MKPGRILFIFLTLISIVSCTQEDTAEENSLLNSTDAIVGQWFLVAIGNTDVSSIECYRDSYLQANGDDMTFFIQDRQEDGSCITVLNETVDYSQEEDFYYIDGEAIEIYIDGDELTWRVDFETTLVFQKD